MDELIDILHRGTYSCVIRHGATTRTFCQRGVGDLWRLCQEEKHFLQGAQIADKVVGKGAAALMIHGGVSEVYAEVISEPALRLLLTHGVKCRYGQLTDRILNRRADGLCPVETRCIDREEITEMVKEINDFINGQH